MGTSSARDDSLYQPRGNYSLCGLHDAPQRTRSGSLVLRDGRYEMTSEGNRAAEPNDSRHLELH